MNRVFIAIRMNFECEIISCYCIKFVVLQDNLGHVAHCGIYRNTALEPYECPM